MLICEGSYHIDLCSKYLKIYSSYMIFLFLFQLEPLESARLDLTTAYTINSLFWGVLVSFVDRIYIGLECIWLCRHYIHIHMLE